ncbi:MAG: alkaline phosphatase D family protein [Bacteroidetes bacterium]|nr:alkaline phosphatase D family protein [Bacteroidota bacterium]
MSKKLLPLLFLLCCASGFAQVQNAKLIAGPMLGFCEHKSVLIWCEVSAKVDAVAVYYKEKNSSEGFKETKYKGQLHQAYNPIKIILGDLKPGTEYEYKLEVDNYSSINNFKTRELWEWRKPAPDFSFIFGSCAYLNDSAYDRPGKSYGQSKDIFKSMGNEKTDLMIWLGDNNYLREADYSSTSGMDYRYSHDRATPELQKIFANQPNYAIWDDHDYGSNDASSNFRLKDYSLEVFKKYWGNMSFGEPDNPATYTTFSWSDADFFLLDDRYFRSPDERKDDTDKHYFGNQQLTWLEDNLLNSKASFKFIINGNQLLNPAKIQGESLSQYSAEYNRLLKFITENKINGLFFISGDRHFSELIQIQPAGCYKLYDYTSSPLTSNPYKPNKPEELNNSALVNGSLQSIQNYGKISVSGGKGNRQLKLQTLDINGKVVYELVIPESELKVK